MLKKIFSAEPVWENGIIFVRIVTAAMIIPHGWEIFDPKQMADMKNLLHDVHFPLPDLMGYVAKCTEIAGGVLLAVGLFTRIITVLLMICMFVVTWLMGGGSPFVSETSSLFFLIFLVFFFQGPGKWSLDSVWFSKK